MYIAYPLYIIHLIFDYIPLAVGTWQALSLMDAIVPNPNPNPDPNSDSNPDPNYSP